MFKPIIRNLHNFSVIFLKEFQSVFLQFLQTPNTDYTTLMTIREIIVFRSKMLEKSHRCIALTAKGKNTAHIVHSGTCFKYLLTSGMEIWFSVIISDFEELCNAMVTKSLELYGH